MNWNEIQKKKCVKKVTASGTVGTTPVVTVSVGKGIAALRVINVNADSTKDLLISKDGGTKWRTIPSDSEREFIEEFDALQIKGSAADCVYEVEYLEYQ